MIIKSLPLALLLFWVTSLQLNAQDSKINLYGSTEIIIGNYKGADFNLNYITKDRKIFKIGFAFGSRKDEDAPHDYDGGLDLLSIAPSAPQFSITTIQMTAGKIYTLKKNKLDRLNLSAGLGYTILRDPTNWQSINPGWLGPNYSYDTKEERTFSLILNPKLEFPASRAIGISISSLLQISPQSFYIGIGFGGIFGRI